MSEPPSTQALYEAHGEYLWGLAYRMLGIRADAEEVVQDAFVRLLRAGPDRARDLRPWLVRVTTNLARDRLRARKREGYVGPWLPAITEVEASVEPLGDARYGAVESASMGFLFAAEQLDDVQRAVLVLRDVLGYSVRETAQILGSSEANVRVIAHRVRARMREWESTQRRSLAVPHEQVITAMRRFFAAVATGDRAAAESMLAADVAVISDGGGEFFAARKPVVGAGKVAGFYLRLAGAQTHTPRIELRVLGGAPTLVLRREASDGEAPVVCMQAQVGDDGRITRIYSVLATAKIVDMLAG